MNHQSKLDELRAQIAEGVYEVDPELVADAVIRHCSSLAAAHRDGLRNADESRRRRLTPARRIAHRRSRSTPEPLAA